MISSKITVAEYLLTRLKEIEVDHLFGVPGDFVLGFFKRFSYHESFDAPSPDAYEMLLWNDRHGALSTLAFGFFRVCQPRLGHREGLSFENAANQLALYTETGRIGLRWFVTDQICI